MAQNVPWGPVDYRSVMDYPEMDELIRAIGPERFIQAVGVERAVEALGAERAIQALGAERVIQALGVERAIAAIGLERVLEVALSQLTPEQQRQLRQRLPSE